MAERPPNSERDPGISKYMKRVKTALTGRHSRSSSSANPTEAMTGTRSTPATERATSAPRPTHTSATAARGAVAAAASRRSRSAAVPAAPVAESSDYTQRWNAGQQARARAVFEKYGFTLEPEEWFTRPVNPDVERIHKPIRMRIRRNCHRCLASFGPDKICPSCHHIRCQKCFRYPPAKQEEASGLPSRATATKGKSAVRPAPAPIPKREKVALTIPSRRGGQDLVRKPIRQRVRRNCHVCNTLFIGGATECTKCKHIRCKKCPRDPPKLHKYPDGYPGDAEPPFERQERVWRKPRRRVRYSCDACGTVFYQGDTICRSCQHERCRNCTRDPPKKIKPEPDPELLRRVEEKLARFNISHDD